MGLEEEINETSATPTDILRAALLAAEREAWDFVIVLGTNRKDGGLRHMASPVSLSEAYGILLLTADDMLTEFRRKPITNMGEE